MTANNDRADCPTAQGRVALLPQPSEVFRSLFSLLSTFISHTPQLSPTYLGPAQRNALCSRNWRRGSSCHQMFLVAALRLTQDADEPSSICDSIPFLTPIIKMATHGVAFHERMR